MSEGSRLQKAPRGLPGPFGQVPAAGTTPAVAGPPAALQPSPAVVEPAPPATPAKRKQGGYYIHDADLARAQAAWKHTELLEGGYRSWSEFQVAALMRLAMELEREHHGGQPFPLLPPGRRIR